MTVSWPKDYFKSLTGLDHEALVSGESFVEAEVDPYTGGAAAVISTPQLDKNGDPTHISIDYFYMNPDGRHQTLNLIDMTFGESDNPKEVQVESVSVLGRAVNIGNGNVNNVALAVQKIHQAILVERELPQAAKIFADCYLEEIIGESLAIPGLSRDGGFSFKPVAREDFHKVAARIDVDVPAVAQALFGLGYDTKAVAGQIPRTSVDPQTKVPYVSKINVQDTPRTVTIKGAIDPIKEVVPKGQRPANIETLVDSKWKSANGNDFALSQLTVMGESLLGEEHLMKMRAIGVINRIMHDVNRKNRDYPKVMDHLTEYDLLSLADPLPEPKNLSEGGNFRVVSQFGNGMDKLVDVFGTELGACKAVIHEGIDENGKRDRVVVFHDFGIFLAKSPSEWTAAAPDVTRWLEDANVFMITHKHLDHCHAISAYAAKDFLRDKIICSTPQVKKALEYQLQKDGVDKKLWPTFHELRGDRVVEHDGHEFHEGEIEIKKDGVTRFTIEYGVDATPHSARCTPYRYIARYGDLVKGSYLNPGDMRFGRHNTDEWDREKLDATFLNKPFFSRGLSGLAERENLPELKGRQDTLCDYDITSLLRKGFAPTASEVEENQIELLSLFKDWDILDARLSTNDGMMESNLRVATHLGRHVSEFGANMQNAARIFNTMGVNPQRCPIQKRQNTQHYLDWYKATVLNKELKNCRRELKNAQARVRKYPDVAKHQRAVRSLQKEKRLIQKVIDLHQEAQTISNANKRFHWQTMCEQKLFNEFHKAMPLGSLRVSRTAKTCKEIAASTPGNVYFVITGSQGTEAESEAQVQKIIEGRSQFDLDSRHRPTAVPLDMTSTAIMISQTPIPGNNASRKQLVQNLVSSRNMPVIDAMHNGFKIHNAPPELHSGILRHFAKTGRSVSQEQDGTIVVTNFPIHAPGHGQERDVMAWVDLINADMNAPQHTDNREAIEEFIKLCQEKNICSPGRIFEDFECVDIDKGHSPKEAVVESVGRVPASIILLKMLRKFRKQYGGYYEGTRVIVHSAREAGERIRALVAGGENKKHESAFGHMDHEDERRKSGVPAQQPPAPTDITRPPARRRYQGYDMTGLEPA